MSLVGRTTVAEAVVRELRRSGTLSRPALVERTGLPRSSVFKVIADLLVDGSVVEAPAPEPAGQPRGRGRPGTLLSLDPRSGLIAGVDVGRQRIRLVIANLAHHVIASGETASPDRLHWRSLASQIDELIQQVCAAEGIDPSVLESIGVGISGSPAIPTSAARSAPKMCEALSERRGVPVLSGNNTRFAGLAESLWGAGRDIDDQIYVRWSGGVGGGFMVRGHLLQGAAGAAGELGHVCVDRDGARCDCGGRGCLEQLIGAAALVEECAQRGTTVASLDELIATARAGNEVVTGVVRAAAQRLGQVLAGTIAQLDPHTVIIGGELGLLDDSIISVIRDEVDHLAIPAIRRRVRIVPAQLGVNDGALGAVAHVLQSRALPAF